MSRTTLGVWAMVLAAGLFAMVNIYRQTRRHPHSMSGRQRAARTLILVAWLVMAVVTPVFGHDGPQPFLTSLISMVIVACLAVRLTDFLD